MVETFPYFRQCFLTLAVLFVTGGLPPTMAYTGCPVVRLSGEYDHQSHRMTTYRVTNQNIADRPVYESETANTFLYYLELDNAWVVGFTPGGRNYRLVALDSATFPELIKLGTFQVFSVSHQGFVLAPNLRVSCSVPGYIGCYYYLHVSGRQLQWSGSSITIDNCRVSCRAGNFPYTALYGQECWCATHRASGATRASGRFCDRPCAGDPLQFCGRRNNWGYTEVYETITDCGPVPMTPGVISVRPSDGANVMVGHTAQVDCWNGVTVTLQCFQNGSFDSSGPFCPEPTTAITETTQGSTTDSDPHVGDRSGDMSTNIIPIVGGLVAGVVFIVIVAVAAFFLVRKRNTGLAQETPASSHGRTHLDNSTYHEALMTSDVVLTDTGAQYLPNATDHLSAPTNAEPHYSTIPEYSSIDEMDRRGAKTPETKNNNLDLLYSKPVKKAKNKSEEGMVDNVLYVRSDDVTDGGGAMDSNSRYVDNDLYG
ncbi:uncharacterized protein LOC144927058 isoform X2 [Branchiostoma floridae x Branchiostoma belcheri]